MRGTIQPAAYPEPADNATKRKTMLTDVGAVDPAMPQDRNRTFEPQIVRKGRPSWSSSTSGSLRSARTGWPLAIRARGAKHETWQHTPGGMSGVGKPPRAFG
jgi:hypothetical protein